MRLTWITSSGNQDEEHPYIQFWEEFGKSIKLGVMEDNANKSKLVKLLRYKTNKSDGKWVSLEDYVAGMPEWQSSIFYIAGESTEVRRRVLFLLRSCARGRDVAGYGVDDYDDGGIVVAVLWGGEGEAFSCFASLSCLSRGRALPKSQKCFNLSLLLFMERVPSLLSVIVFCFD